MAMSSYHTSVAVFDVPSHWQDQSIIAFRLPAAPGSGSDASFVLTKDTGKGIKPFSDHFDEQAGKVSRALPGYHEVRRELFQANECDAAWLEFQFEKDGRAMQLRQIYYDRGFLAVIFTLTAPSAAIGFYEEEWRRVMASIVFDPPPAAPDFPRP